ncbi:MAG: hypothetical protein ACFFE8_06930 [Candidatus Heimdallarchaeota archaeon]
MSEVKKTYSMSKDEIKIYSTLQKYGSQSRQELLLASELQAEKAENALKRLLEIGFVQEDGEMQLISPVIPFDKITELLDSNLSKIVSVGRDQNETIQHYRKKAEESIEEYRSNLESKLGTYQDLSGALVSELQESLGNWESEQIEQTNGLFEEIKSTLQDKLALNKSMVQQVVAQKVASLEKNWTSALDELQRVQSTGVRIFNEAMGHYDQDLSEAIQLASEKISDLHTQLSEITNTLESVFSSQVQEFFSSADVMAKDFKNNINSGIQESWKREEDFISGIRQQVQVSLVKNVTNELQKVVNTLSKDLDADIDRIMKNIHDKTEEIIKDQNKHLEAQFQNFKENAKELLQEQKVPLSVLQKEVTEISSGQKLDRSMTTFLQQLAAQFTAESTSLEANYRQIQKSAMETLEEIRDKTKKNLLDQNSEFENLIGIITEEFEKIVANKERDVFTSQQIAQSLNQFLENLLVSIPMRATQLKSSAREALEDIPTELRENLQRSTVEAVNSLHLSLTETQQRVENTFKENQEESQREFSKLLTSSEQLSTTVSSLRTSYTETIENRFAQRAKVMNTELEAISRNFQQVLHGFEDGVGDMKGRLSAEGELLGLETSLQTSINQIKTDLDQSYSQTLSDSKEYLDSVNSSLQSSLEETLNVIREGITNLQSDFKKNSDLFLDHLKENSQKQQGSVIQGLDATGTKISDQITGFKENYQKIIEENQKSVEDYLVEGRRGTEEVISLHKANIVKYQEKGPADVLSFITQIETEVATQNKNLTDALEDLISAYSGISEATFGDISGTFTQFHESGDRLSSATDESIQLISSAIGKANDSIDQYFSDTITELENQISVATGLITSEISSSAGTVRNEINKSQQDYEVIIKRLNSELSASLSRQETEFITKIPELEKDLSLIFNQALEERELSSSTLEKRIAEDLEELKQNWLKQIGNAETKIQDLISGVTEAVDANTENLEKHIQSNIEQIAKQIVTLYSFSPKEDVFELTSINDQVKAANKRLKSGITEGLRPHIETLDQKFPELLSEHDAMRNQIEEDLDTFVDDFRDNLSSVQSSVSNQIHTFMKDERKQMNFADEKDELNTISKNFAEASKNQNEAFSEDLAGSINLSATSVSKSKSDALDSISNIPEIFTGSISNLNEEVILITDSTREKLKELGQDTRADMRKKLDSFRSDFEKSVRSMIDGSHQVVRDEIENMNTRLIELTNKSENTFKEITDETSEFKDALRTISLETGRAKPLDSIRFVHIPNDAANQDYLSRLIESTTKQLTIFVSDPPRFLSLPALKRIPPEKRIWIYTNYDFSKKGKKWLNELGKQVNVNLRKAKTDRKITGLIGVVDSKLVLILPDTIGIVSSDSNLVENITNLLSLLKGAPI